MTDPMDIEKKEYYNQIAKQGERDAFTIGLITGGLLFLTSIASLKSYSQMYKPISSYTIGVVSSLIGLTSSQIVTHYIFIRISDQIKFQKRLEAHERFEMRKQGLYSTPLDEAKK